MTEYTEEFERFWKAYPSRWNMNLHSYVKRKKWPAFKVWQKLSKELKAECMAKVRLVKATEGTPRDAVTWLNQRGWDDIELPEEKWKPSLPKEMTNSLKSVPQQESMADKSNREVRKLMGKEI